MLSPDILEARNQIAQDRQELRRVRHDRKMTGVRDAMARALPSVCCRHAR
jgi:hypothetical protein